MSTVYDREMEELRARVLVILSEASHHPLTTGYACRRIMAEVVSPLVGPLMAREPTTDLLGYARRLRAAYSRETSELEDQWTPDNPSIGQCHVTALLIQEKFGGHIVEGHAHPHLVVHFWNVIDGITVDITRDQFDPEVLRFCRIGPAYPPNQTTIRKADLLRERAQ